MSYKSNEEDRWLWRVEQAREHGAELAAQDLLGLFGDELPKHIEEWLRGYADNRKMQATTAEQHIDRLTAKMIKEIAL